MKYELCNAINLVGGPQDGEQLFFTSEVPPLTLAYKAHGNAESYHQYDLDGGDMRYCGVVVFADEVDYE